MKVIKPLTNKEIQEFKPELKQYKKGDGKGLYIISLKLSFTQILFLAILLANTLNKFANFGLPKFDTL